MTEAKLTDRQRQQVLVEWNRTEAPFPEACFHQLFEQQVDATPDVVAADFHGETLTYAELDGRANQLAHHLRRLGARPDARIAICLERGLQIAVAVLGVMKSGAAYVPLDPNAPRNRQVFVLDDADVEVVVTQKSLAERFDDRAGPVVDVVDVDTDAATEPTERPEVALDPRNLAYLIYTSGSTGTPKGILVPHRGVCNMGTSEVRDFRTRVGDRVLQVAPLVFDVSIWEMAMTWLAGATLVFATEEEIVDASILDAQGITVAAFTPSLLARLDPAVVTRLHTVISVGEACNPRVVKRWAPGRRLINVYGPTETTGHCATIDLHDDGSGITIGRPIHNVKLYILDDAMEPVPIGETGELHVSSPGITRGYVKRPGLTAERFVPDPFGPEPGGRLYKTGDMCRYLPDGRIEFLGRIDDQVKVRGFRIELGEIESVLAAVPGVAGAAVSAREDQPGDTRLVAYVVAEEGAPPLAEDGLRQALRDALPAYMVPAHIVELPHLPLTPNGKLDRKALPAPEELGAVGVGAAAGRRDVARPRTATESVLVGVWEEVLQKPVGPDDNFFDLGGHSLLAAQIVVRLGEELGVDVPVRALFVSPTVEELSRVVDEAASAGGGAGG